jgi:eukaryotic translation initiation factor 2C
MHRPFDVFEEDSRYRSELPSSRVARMYEKLKAKMPGPPMDPPAQLLLCILPVKNCELYGRIQQLLLCIIFRYFFHY